MKPDDLIYLFKKENVFQGKITLQRGEFLSTAGCIDTNIYFVESGSLKVYILDDGEERIVRFGYQNNIVVSLDSFFTKNPSEFYFQALKKTTASVL